MAGVLCSMVGASFVTAVAEVIRFKKGITAIGNAQVDTAQSKFGGASYLGDGVGDRLIANGDFSQTANFTVEFWFRAADVVGNQGLVAIGNESSGRQNIYLSSSTPKLNPYGAGDSISSSSNISINTWYHLAIVRSSTTVTMYLNGSSVGSATISGTFGNANGLYVGDISDGAISYNGWIDEVRVSNSARYTAGFTPSTTPFVNDADTVLLIHCDGTDAVTYFEDDNGVRSPKAITAIGNAQVSTAQSKFGGASALFDGTGDYIRALGSDFTFSTNQDFTVELWVYITATSNTRAFFTLVDGTTVRAVLYITSTQLSLYSPGLGGLSLGDFPSANTWHHMALSRSGNTTRVFFNGTETYSTTTSWTASSDRLLLGTDGESTVTNPYIGYIDEVRVSNTARYTAGFTSSTTPFVNDANTLFLSHMDGTNASTVVRDDVGVGRSARGIQAIGNAQVDTAQSKFSGASALFDGTGDSLTVNFSSNTDFEFTAGEDFTLEAWVRPAATPSFAGIISLGSARSGNEYNLYTEGGQLRAATYGGTNLSTTASSLAIGTWYHVAVSRSGTSVKLFLNGTQVDSDTYTFTAGQQSTIKIGSFSDGSLSWNGHIDEVRVSNTARYTASFTAPTTPFQNDANTLLLLHMDGTDAATVFVDDNGKTPT